MHRDLGLTRFTLHNRLTFQPLFTLISFYIGPESGLTRIFNKKAPKKAKFGCFFGRFICNLLIFSVVAEREGFEPPEV